MEYALANPKSRKSLSSKDNKYKKLLTSFLSPKKSLKKASTQSTDFLKQDDSTDSLYSVLNKNKDTKDVKKFNFHEPVYSTVKKMKCDCSKTQEIKEDRKLLQERCKELAEENRKIKKQLENYIREEKQEENSRHAQLQLQITQLEADTRKEVTSLTERIRALMSEKSILEDQMDSLIDEKMLLNGQVTTLQNQVKVMNQEGKELKHQNLVFTDKMDVLVKEKKELDHQSVVLREQVNVLCQEKRELSQQYSKEMSENNKKHEEEIQTLKCQLEEGSQKRILEERSNLLKRVEESNEVAQETHRLLTTLLAMAENLAMERDVLLNKTSFQEHQQKELHTTVVDYSLSLGRLQEHIYEFEKRMDN